MLSREVSLLCRMPREGFIERIFMDSKGGVVKASEDGWYWRGKMGHM